MKHTFNNRVFHSKKAIDEYIREDKNDFLKNEKGFKIGPGHILFPFFKEIVNVHNDKDEKIGCGIDFFILRKPTSAKTSYKYAERISRL